MTEGTDFYRLQTLNSEQDAKQRRLAEVEASLGESDALKQARQAEEKEQQQVQKWSARQRDLDLEIQGVAAKIARSEQRLYSGTVKNPKELEDLQSEIASLRRRQQALEDDLLAVMIERDESQEALERARQHLAETEAQWSTDQADLMKEREALEQRLGEIEEEIAGVLPVIDPSDLAIYQDLRRRKGGVAVVQLSDGTCTGCGVLVSSNLQWQLREGELVQCGNCERIVVEV